jgi:hypothetical protein
MLSVVMLNVVMQSFYAECPYTKCHNIAPQYTQSCFSECCLLSVLC